MTAVSKMPSTVVLTSDPCRGLFGGAADSMLLKTEQEERLTRVSIITSCRWAVTILEPSKDHDWQRGQ